MLTTGENNQLTITIRKYEPVVECEPNAANPPSPNLCKVALDCMPARRRPSYFIPQVSPLQGREYVNLPREFVYRKSPLSNLYCPTAAN